MIQLENIKKIFRTEEVETWALREVNLEVKEGEFVAIMGPSGCGKSTLLNILGLLDNPSEGKYLLDGKEVSTLKESERTDIRKGVIGFVFQSFNLIDELNVYENIELPLLYMGVPAKVRRQRVEAVMDRMAISHRRKHFPCQLSGGQQQRVAIARALISEPEIVVCDEAVSALDVSVQAQILNLLNDLQKRLQVSYLFISHDISVVNYMADRIAVMLHGKIIEQGSSEAVLQNPRNAYTRQLLDCSFANKANRRL